MYVIKRNGKQENVKFDKITARIQKLCYGLNPDHVNSRQLHKKLCKVFMMVFQPVS
jgi:predicted transcriptional regulator